MRVGVLSVASPVSLVLVTLLAAPPAFARTVRCESRDNRYRYCRVDTYGDVELKRQLSRSDCRYRSTWGYDHRGVWVDRGCRAEFAVDEGRRHRSSRYDRYDHYDHRDDHDSGKAAAAVAGVAVGAALIAALVNSKNKNKHHSDDHVPSWMVGRFEGYNVLRHHDVELEISPSGAVTGRGPGQPSVHGRYDEDGYIEFGRTKFDVERNGSGFTLTQRGDRDNVIVYHRDR